MIECFPVQSFAHELRGLQVYREECGLGQSDASPLANNRLSCFFDGTFNCVPAPFKQLLILMVYDNSSTMYVPVVYILVERKTEWTYWEVFHNILVMCRMNFDLAMLHCDFEMAMIKAAKDQFLEITLFSSSNC